MFVFTSGTSIASPMERNHFVGDFWIFSLLFQEVMKLEQAWPISPYLTKKHGVAQNIALPDMFVPRTPRACASGLPTVDPAGPAVSCYLQPSLVFFSSSFSAHDVVNEFESSRSQGLGSGRLEALLLSIPALPVTVLPQGCLFLLGHLGTVMVIRKDINVLFLR